MDPFSHGFVDIIAAEQTPDSSSWFQGTADAVRQAARHFARYDADYYLILAGDHLYRMDYGRMLDAHVDQDADITVAALPVTPEDAPAMGIFRFDREGRSSGSKRSRTASASRRSAAVCRRDSRFTIASSTPTKPFIASMGIYVFSREVLLDLLQNTTVTDFGREIIPGALQHAPRTRLPARRLLGRRRHRRVVLRREHHADGAARAVQVLRSTPARSTRTSGFFRRRTCARARCASRSWPMGAFSMSAPSSSRSSASARTSRGARASRARCCSAPTCTTRSARRWASAATSLLDRVIIDKNASIGDGARLLNKAGVQHADGDGYYIRSGIIIVPKGGRIAAGTVV